MGKKEPRITVIIAHDPARKGVDLDGLKCDILDQIDAEIFIAEDGSKSSARNSAAHKSEGDILVFLDDDVILRRNFFQELLIPFEFADVGAVGGVNLAPPEIQGSKQITAVLMSSPLLWLRSVSRYTPRGNVRESDEAELIGCCLAIRKKAFNQAGGFPEDVIPCEENVLIQRLQILGWKVIYSPFAIIYHDRASFPWGYCQKVFDYGTGRGIMMRRGGSGGFPRSLWKPSWKWIPYVAGFFLHHSSYIMGVFYGFLIKKKYQERDEKK